MNRTVNKLYLLFTAYGRILLLTDEYHKLYLQTYRAPVKCTRNWAKLETIYSRQRDGWEHFILTLTFTFLSMWL